MDNTNKLATRLLFSVLFPESNGFKSQMSASAKHCLVRAIQHLHGNIGNTRPSTNEGVLIPLDMRIGD